MRLKTSKYDRTGAITFECIWLCKPLIMTRVIVVVHGNTNSFYGKKLYAPLGDVLSIICGDAFAVYK